MLGTQRSDLGKHKGQSFMLGSLLVFGAFAVATPVQAALTPPQVSAIISLLASFEVDQATIANVWTSLLGEASKGSVSFIAAAQPADARVPAGAKLVPFTTFMVANNTGGAVEVSGVTVTRSGSGSDSSFSSVELMDSAGIQIGVSRKLDSSHQATVGDTFTLKAGEVRTLTVAGTIAAKGKAKSGRTVSLQVGAINVSAALYGSLPIVGASYTIDTSTKSAY